jgi:hypothetical protein
MTQAELFPRNALTSDTGAADDRRTPEPSRSARGHRQTLAQRRVLARIDAQQKHYDRTRSHRALQRLKDARTEALRLGV